MSGVEKVFNTDFTDHLRRWQEGDQRAYERLFELVFGEIRRMASRELRRRGKRHTWSTTDLAHEIMIRMLKRDHQQWKNKEHFINTAALGMFQILIDYGRGRNRRVDGQKEVNLEDMEQVNLHEQMEPGFAGERIDVDKLIDLRNAIYKLKALNERLAAITVMKLNYGMRAREIADCLGCAENTVNNLWPRCKKFLALELGGNGLSRNNKGPDDQ